MASERTLCMVHNNIDDSSSIGKIAKWGVEQALAAGWRVTVVARDVDPGLIPDVQWLPLYVPPRLHLLQWLAARATIRRAIGDRHFDVLHVHQAQVATLADVMQCHYLTRPAFERGALAEPSDLRKRMLRMQQLGVLRFEDAYFGRWNAGTTILFASELLREEFARHYGCPPRGEVLLCPAPPVLSPDRAGRAAARSRWAPEAGDDVTVVGFLGGLDYRKGYDRAVAAVAADPKAFLVAAGPGSEGASFPELGRRQRWWGQVTDVHDLLGALDVLLVPSRFEPFGLVCLEAAAAGIPVIATDEVGALATLTRFSAGLRWDPGEPLEPLLAAIRERRAQFEGASRTLAGTLTAERQGRRLLEIYEETLASA